MKDGEVALMQIDCEVLDTHIVSVPSSDIEPVEQGATLYSEMHYHNYDQNLSRPSVDRLKHNRV